ncbi:DUF2496 domain-containing protein [Shewanella psychropiezotolerans]|uniref:DUF2496 domain-containing protein n=1 Tax=Shewanella psychropiezotolerans TaxID=2593655 RepID=A0ABX5WVW9_9GAMM|nr:MULTISPECIES: YbaM family protein [Shewanella]MPY22437.1 DUF2496 domain-containing protein [Shewanella sp. YLB-07]QDO83246.1 DUF2496 domain-containing protein [Shewanella psychropiezotolerans]
MSKLNIPESEKVPTNPVEQEGPSSLDDAAEDIKLAVDLIYLFESNKIETEVALSAIEIVKADLMSKRGKPAI